MSFFSIPNLRLVATKKEYNEEEPAEVVALGDFYAAGLANFTRINNTSDYLNGWTRQLTPNAKLSNVWTNTYSAYIKTETGDFYAWGNNSRGQLGLGDTTARNVPTLVSSIPNFTQMNGGVYHMLGVTSDGQLWSIGRNSDGQLGLGNNTDTTSWTQVTTVINSSGQTVAIGPVKKVVATDYGSVILTEAGDIYVSGFNSLYGFSVSSFANRFTYVTANITDFDAIQNFAIAINTSGQLIRWGNTYEWRVRVSGARAPNILSSATNWTRVAAGYWGFAAVNDTNELYVIGYNSNGQFASLPATWWPVDALTNIPFTGGQIEEMKFAKNSNDAFFLRTAAGDLYATGENSYGQLGLGTDKTDKYALTLTNTGVLQVRPEHATMTFILKE